MGDVPAGRHENALIAAISTEGLKQLYSTIEEGLAARRREPAALLIEIGLGYLRFALEELDRFKLMYSSVMDKERDFRTSSTIRTEPSRSTSRSSPSARRTAPCDPARPDSSP